LGNYGEQEDNWLLQTSQLLIKHASGEKKVGFIDVAQENICDVYAAFSCSTRVDMSVIVTPPSELYHAGADCENGGLRAVSNPELGKNEAHVVFYSTLREKERLGNVSVTQTGR